MNQVAILHVKIAKMIQPLKKQQIIALFGQAAAAKLFALIDSCCPILTLRGEVTCTGSIDDPYCLSVFVTSSVSLSNTPIQVNLTDINVNSDLGLGGNVTSPAGVEVLVSTNCKFKDSVYPGIYNGSGFAFLPGTPLVPYAWSVNFPDCGGTPPPVTNLLLTKLASGSPGVADFGISNGYGGSIYVEESIDTIMWITIDSEPLPSSPYTGGASTSPKVVPGLYYRGAVKDSVGNLKYSNVILAT